MRIDWWTLGIQTVNVLILMWLLAHFFWRPITDAIERRRAAAQQLLAAADASRTQAAKAASEMERTRAGLDQQREELVAAATKSAEKARQEILASATREAEALRAAARTAIAQDQAQTEALWADRANQLAVEIAGRLVARLGTPALNAVFLDWLLAEIRKLPQSERRGADGAVLEAVSAAPITPDEQLRYQQLIAEAFGARPQISFRSDPALIAGLELHGPHLIINNSWRADLAGILADIAHDD